MFDELSDQVFEATHIRLSVTTLKRFFEVVEYRGMPSITTLDTLAKYVGRSNWREFKLESYSSKKLRPPYKTIYVAIGFAMALLIVFIIGNKRPDIQVNASDFSFSSQPLSTEYPNTVVFNFDIPDNLPTDSLHIQQYWDVTKTIRIDKTQKQATGIYYFPGYFRAKLMVEGEPALEHDLFLKSNGWLGTINYQPIPKYFIPIPAESFGLSLPQEIVTEVKRSENPISTTFHFIDNLGNVPADHFSLSTIIQNVFDDRWAVCQSFQIYIIGTKGAMIIPFSKKGCSSDLNLMLNDVYLSGKEHDLSALSADFSSPVSLRLEVKDQGMIIHIHEKEVYRQAYNDSMGKLVGLRYRFQSPGKVISMLLKDQKGQEVRL